MSSTPQIPPSLVVPPDPHRETEATTAGDSRVEEATADEIEAEVDVVSSINDPAKDDVFKHLRRASGKDE